MILEYKNWMHKLEFLWSVIVTVFSTKVMFFYWQQRVKFNMEDLVLFVK